MNNKRPPQQLTILGATGSIGKSSLDVCARHPDRYQIFALTAAKSINELQGLVIKYQPKFAVVSEARQAQQLQQQLQSLGSNTEVLYGLQGLKAVATHDKVDAVMAAIVGAAGLPPTLAAVAAGKKVLLANKEALVTAGKLFMDAVAASGATLLPIDSEHNAIFQCLPHDYQRGLSEIGVKRILLTGSGGPFRSTPLDKLSTVTPEQACAHPNWSMGRKISVDSATMMNKGLELVEACWLFNTQPEWINIVVHPQSVIHSMVEYVDGSVLAQLGNPDMRTPIAHALAWPERIESGVPLLDIISTARLDFQAPDYQRFPCLQLTVDALNAGGTALTVLNAANEIAVAAFLAQQIKFTDIPVTIDRVLSAMDYPEPDNLEVVTYVDEAARQKTAELLAKL